VLCLALLGGCSSMRDSVANVPPPSFNPPVAVAPTPPVHPPYVPPKVEPVKPTPPVKVPVASAGPAEWKPKAPARPWKYIVVHHSDTSTGGAERFGKFHKDKGWDELGYHFVIGNGTETTDGQVEVGPRWPKQKWGAHTKTADNRYNDFGVGICLVGNFQDSRPTSQQMQSLAKLVAYLQKTYKIPSQNIIGHRDAKATECPGRLMDIAQVRRLAAQLSADATWTPDRETIAAGEELLQDAAQ
jgi:N-acetylmuramoyl-L-alanine amidase